MLKFLKIFSKKPDESDPKYRVKMARRLSGKHIRYVTEKRDGVDEVIGREGSLTLRNDEFIVFSSGDILFRANASELQAWELLSLDGVVLTAPDLTHGGEIRTIIAYYVYYR